MDWLSVRRTASKARTGEGGNAHAGEHANTHTAACAINGGGDGRRRHTPATGIIDWWFPAFCQGPAAAARGARHYCCPLRLLLLVAALVVWATGQAGNELSDTGGGIAFGFCIVIVLPASVWAVVMFFTGIMLGRRLRQAS